MPAPRKQKDDGWVFDFLTSMHCADSDDSDQEDGSIPSALPVVTEAKLLKDMDLSTREETVVYKPNPFSIAKMNAAYRTQAPIKKTVAPPNAALPTIKSGQKTLAEGFALQKQKSKPLPSRPVSMPFRVKPPAKVFSMKEERPSENSVPLHTSSPLKASQMVPHNALQERFSEQFPNTHISTANVSRLGSALLCLSISLISHLNFPLFICSPLDGQQNNAQFGYYTENYLSKSNPLSFSSPIAPPARPINTNPNRDHDTPAAYFSSPLKPQPSYDPRMQAPSRPQPINNFRPRLPAKFQPPSRHVFRKEISLLKFPNTNSIGRAMVGPPTPNVPFKYEEIVNPDLHLCFTEGINKFEAIDRADLDLYPNETVVHPMAPRRQKPFEQPATILPPASDVSIFPIESRVKARPNRDAYHFSAEDPDEEWSTLPSRKKTKQSLPLRPAVSKFTKPFRLPGILPVRNNAQIEEKAITRRVHVYLPPPPPANEPSALNKNPRTPPHRHPQEARKRQRFSDTRMESAFITSKQEDISAGAEAYPSPKRAQLLRPQHQAYPNFKDEDEIPNDLINSGSTPYRPPSPPTSDLAIPADANAETESDDGEVNVQVDTERIREGYRIARAFAKKVLLDSLTPFLCLTNLGLDIFFSPASSADRLGRNFGACWDFRAVVSFVKM